LINLKFVALLQGLFRSGFCFLAWSFSRFRPVSRRTRIACKLSQPFEVTRLQIRVDLRMRGGEVVRFRDIVFQVVELKRRLFRFAGCPPEVAAVISYFPYEFPLAVDDAAVAIQVEK